METRGIPIACAHTAMLLSHAAQAPGRFGHRSSGGRRSFSVRALHLARSTSSPVIPPFSPIDEKNYLPGKGISASRIERLESERSSLSRLDVELMLRRMVRAEEEESEKDAGEEPDNTNDSGHRRAVDKQGTELPNKCPDLLFNDVMDNALLHNQHMG